MPDDQAEKLNPPEPEFEPCQRILEPRRNVSLKLPRVGCKFAQAFGGFIVVSRTDIPRGLCEEDQQRQQAYCRYSGWGNNSYRFFYWVHYPDFTTLQKS